VQSLSLSTAQNKKRRWIMIVLKATKKSLKQDHEGETVISFTVDASQVIEVAKLMGINDDILLELTIKEAVTEYPAQQERVF